MVKPVPPPFLLPSTGLKSCSRPPPLLSNKSPRLFPPKRRLLPYPPASPMPIKPIQSHHALSLPNGYYLQNIYAATLTNGTATYLHPGTQQNGTVQQLQLKNAFTNGQPDMAIAVKAHALRSTSGMSSAMEQTSICQLGPLVLKCRNGLGAESCALTTNAMGGGSTEPASCRNRTIALPACARAYASASGLNTSWSPETNCVAFATSATGGPSRWVWRDVLSPPPSHQPPARTRRRADFAWSECLWLPSEVASRCAHGALGAPGQGHCFRR
jgi:hypothetical protein